ncbi:hypothetical protein DMC30DRAFT_157862 [Rhodotorula diobovata]|uniref:Uncharacterized protein n=1 Tax=Rhodotorula diobovata TaxID=5288 RepID=A0A5C5G2Y1_9BASI|nr:hypothetical protein DMC30DRAFT_157862 [Rhodotorula diobovata]
MEESDTLLAELEDLRAAGQSHALRPCEAQPLTHVPAWHAASSCAASSATQADIVRPASSTCLPPAPNHSPLLGVELAGRDLSSGSLGRARRARLPHGPRSARGSTPAQCTAWARPRWTGPSPRRLPAPSSVARDGERRAPLCDERTADRGWHCRKRPTGALVAPYCPTTPDPCLASRARGNNAQVDQQLGFGAARRRRGRQAEAGGAI